MNSATPRTGPPKMPLPPKGRAPPSRSTSLKYPLRRLPTTQSPPAQPTSARRPHCRPLPHRSLSPAIRRFGRHQVWTRSAANSLKSVSRATQPATQSMTAPTAPTVNLTARHEGPHSRNSPQSMTGASRLCCRALSTNRPPPNRHPRTRHLDNQAGPSPAQRQLHQPERRILIPRPIPFTRPNCAIRHHANEVCSKSFP